MIHMPFLKIILSILLVGLVLSCDQVDLKSGEKKEAEPKLSLENFKKFTYVAIKHVGPYEDFDLLKEEFLYEIKNQQIIVTGSPFLIYYNNPENTPPSNLEWEIGIPTAEGTMVKYPLVLKTWVYEKVAKVEKDEVMPITKNIYPLIFEQIYQNNLTYQGPTAIRILNNIENDSSKIVKTEVWIPLVSNNHLAE
jgi:DNA gyrase inhibitor GyrI